MTGIRVTISPGELLDRLTIYEVRADHTDGAAQKAARRERDALARLATHLPASTSLEALRQSLYAVNTAIWEVEDLLRVCMKAGELGPIFVKAARDAHGLNDKRSQLKAEVNKLLGAAPEPKIFGGQEAG